MYASVGHVHGAQAFIQVLGKTGWATQVNVVVIQRQCGLHLLDAKPANMLVVTALHSSCFRLAQAAVQAQQLARLLSQAVEL
ncbi:hypothetical protein D3C81_1146470 [compost metagenome]